MSLTVIAMVNKTGVRKAQPPMQLGRITRSKKNCTTRINDEINLVETSVQAIEEDVEGQLNERDQHIADASHQNGCQNEGDDHILNELNHEGHNQNGTAMNELKFQTDVTSPPVKKACVAMMKKAVRQQRYKLKKKYFDACPLHLVPKTSPVTSMSNDQWDKLVDYWKSEEKMVISEKNKTNRSKVQFHQTTGSRSYEMHIVNLANKYQNEPPNALDLFKELHYSKTKGFTPIVQSIIAQVEDKIHAPLDDGEESKDVTDAVFEVLGQKNKKNGFLANVGMKTFLRADNAESQRELQAELVAEQQTSNDLRELVKTQQQQMDEMMKKFQESETARARQDEELKNKQAETDALIKGLMSMIPASLPTR
uniref:Uncharacterized protein n=1 Tax=Oryza brachyantha TaxID=4533 RepID=J3LR70_ORYBR